MNREEILYERFFGRNDELILSKSERSLARLVYGVACGKILDDDDDSVIDEPDNYSDGDDVVEATMDIFKRINELLKVSSEKRNAFCKSVHDWLSYRKRIIQRLKEIAEEIQADRLNSDIAKVVGGVVGTVGGVVVGLSLLTPLAGVTVPLSIVGGVAAGLGSSVFVGTASTEIVLLKNKLEEVKTLIMQERSIFSILDPWFAHVVELEKAIKSLIDYDLLKEMSEDVQRFLDGRTDPKNIAISDFKNIFKHVSKLCLRKMCKYSNIKKKFGDKLTPVVMTFIFMVFLTRDDSRIVLDSIMITRHLTLDTGVKIFPLYKGIGIKSKTTLGVTVKLAMARIAAAATCFAFAIAIDLINVVLHSIRIHNRTKSKHSQYIRDAVEQLEKPCLFIESYCYELNSYKSISWTAVTQWKSVVIHHIPDDVGQLVIKKALKTHIPEEATGCVKLLRLPTDGNNWLVMVPVSHSQKLLRQSYMIIKEKRCLVTH